MKRKKKTEFRIDIEETFVLTRPAGPSLAWCAGCNRLARMICVDEATALTGASSRAVYRAVERGEIHFIETPEGLLRVCLDSLSLLQAR